MGKRKILRILKKTIKTLKTPPPHPLYPPPDVLKHYTTTYENIATIEDFNMNSEKNKILNYFTNY